MENNNNKASNSISDKAARLLFGRTDIGDEKNDIDNSGRLCIKCMNGIYAETGQLDDLKGVLHCTKCGHEINRWLYSTLLPRGYGGNKIEAPKLVDKKNIENVLLSDQQDLLKYAGIAKYCQENNITPDQLIEQHSYWAKMNHELLGEAIKDAAKGK